MRANKTTLLFVLALFVILFCVALANIRYISTPRLVIKFDGKPASNVTLILPDGGDRLRVWSITDQRLQRLADFPSRDNGWDVLLRIFKTDSLVPRD